MRKVRNVWENQYEVMQQNYQRLRARENVESIDCRVDLVNFLISAWSLKDWIKNDLSTGLSDSIERKLSTNTVFSICADLANGAKHLNLRYERVGAKYSSVMMHANTAHMNEVYPAKYFVSLPNASFLDAFVFAEQVIDEWDSFLKQHDLI